MKKYLYGLSFFIFLLFLFGLKPSEVSAQACTGDSGDPGQCEASQACPPARIDGQGTCTESWQICCLDSGPPPGGNLDCGDACTPGECRSGLSCTNGICAGSTCPLCTGDSGYAGTCLQPVVCTGRGRNAGDGNTGCSSIPGSVCCTNAPSSESCSLSASQALVGAFFTVNLTSTTPDTFYNFQTSPTCTGSCLSAQRTDTSGNLSCTLDCGPPAGTYTVSANSGNTSCSIDVGVLNQPGLSCTGVNSGLQGVCAVGISCPQGYPDTDGQYPDVCTAAGEICCVPSGGGSGIGNPLGRGGCGSNEVYTAIGCIPVENQNDLLAFFLRWAIGIAGGIALLLIAVAGFLIITSSGDPQRLQSGKELLTSAVAGLLLLIFSVFILRLIGVNILGIF